MAYTCHLSNYYMTGTLNLYLKNKSEHYDDPAKKAIFLLNNYNYIVSSLQSSGIVTLVSSLDNKMEMTYQQLVSLVISFILPFLRCVMRVCPSITHELDSWEMN